MVEPWNSKNFSSNLKPASPEISVYLSSLPYFFLMWKLREYANLHPVFREETRNTTHYQAFTNKNSTYIPQNKIPKKGLEVGRVPFLITTDALDSGLSSGFLRIRVLLGARATHRTERCHEAPGLFPA